MRHQSDAPELRAHFRGEIIAAGDNRYEEARKLYNGMIDKHPRLIARCADVADVVAAVNFGREHELLIAHFLGFCARAYHHAMVSRLSP